MKRAIKAFCSLKYQEQGFSLLEVIMAVGILGIMTWATTGMIISLMNENKVLSEKLESIELEQSVNRLTTESIACSCIDLCGFGRDFHRASWTLCV